MRLLRADDSLSPLLKHDRPYRCSLALIDANELERQQRAPGFMTVRFIGRHHTNHVWPLKPLEIEPMAHPPEYLDERSVRFYEEHCKALHAPKEEEEEPSPPPMPAPPANLAEVLEEAGKRMAAANKLLLLLTASVQLQQGGVGGGGEAEASASSSLEVKLRPMLTLVSETYKAQKAQKALRGTPLYQGNVLGATAPAMEALRKLSASHRTTHQGTKEESAAAQMIIDDDGWGYAIECMWGGFMRKTFGDIPNAPIEESVTISRCGLELAEEVLFRTRPPPPSSFAAEKEARLLIRLLCAG